ncbi:Tm-1-like ATP-binding domain-containing protein [Modestobacter sp. L9-4]|uniref:Tm-1-like ATP-binding domain-containing protein n=1 Tax=Modestobacter sp. L9-4 TaxID=2851567 RepID=UPI001C746294|nr:Tm-1-like ATP-binding domain-containing protein [Modestobacter sp. L9-4]QXG76736.1 Tm-1-like ATP-binding domain-containing protein [Modestobacter sp. L9-4]
MATVVLVGTFDTKGAEYGWLREQLEAAGCTVTAVDVGSFTDGTPADVPATEVAARSGVNVAPLLAARDRGAVMTAMGAGAAVVLRELYDRGELDAVLAVGGSGGSSVAAPAMQALPVGVPKLLVSTMASGDVAPYVGQSDVTLMYSVVDISGLNSISRAVLGNAAAAAAGMALAHERRTASPEPAGAPLIGASMFGLTTPAVDEARAWLTELGYEVLVFHATGAGGRAMEGLADAGLLTGVLDLTTTELADDLVGGVLTAGPHRLEAAGRRGIPQVVSVGALDMVNFGGRETVPAEFADRQFLVHNPTVTLMRTTVGENAELGRRIAAKVAAATGPVEVLLPMGGVSGIDVPDGPFVDPDADAALFTSLADGLSGTDVPVVEFDGAINNPGFGRLAAERLHALITAAKEN